MKSFKPIYYAFTLCCLAAAFSSCDSSTYDATLETESQEESGTRMSLVIHTPSATETGNTSYQYEEECYINDVAVYIFEANGTNDTFREKVSNPILSGNNGFSTKGCTVFATLNENYANTKVKVVVLTNLTARGLSAPTLTVGDSPEELFNLTYNFNLTENSAWQFQGLGESVSYTPMYGISEATIQAKEINSTSISLYRAIARVDVVFNDGKGFEGFTVNSVTLNKYNTQGTCATNNLTEPQIPAGSGIGTEAAFFEPSKGTDVYKEAESTSTPVVWRLYVPEYDNTTSSDPELTLTINGQFNNSSESKSYTLKFIKKTTTNGEEKEEKMDIIRNNLYIFKITSITQAEPANISCSLEVEEWTKVENEVTFY